ncbi:expressed unknown protein [Seminavis robusta]|uniref:Uncharacterized protein n=1 Tax=Seminavis robusta TaxID=568900 RepID=A0A9N8DJV8_9STRA|nr:expressed unknown protein [Seminavis robusta]|eukprot:Sro198_g084180.1 n/a (158) ;mRNA; r:80047-80520
MVLDVAYVAGTIASFVMNGACCMYQTNREDFLREELRDEIRKEWVQQRRREVDKQHQTQREQRKEFEERYQKLLTRNEDQSYTHRHHLSPKHNSTTTPQERDPPNSVDSQYMRNLSRNSSIMDEEEDDNDDKDHERVGDGLGIIISEDGTMEDVSIS